jgi:dTDP-4-amino-4,6-dideoxygalactose transaminase
MNVPFLDLKAHHAPLQAEILRAVERVMIHNVFILGPEVATLEERVAIYTGVGHAIGVSSGTDALLVALMALGVGGDDDVVTTAFSFFATAGVIARLGARPIFVDIDPVTFNLNPDRLEMAITPRTKGIIVVHLYGQLADVAPIIEVARARGIPVIEDAAQAIGAEYIDGRRAGAIGTVGCLSFFPSKNLGAIGDAGMVLTNDDALAGRVRILRVHGGSPKHYHKTIGGNFRLDAVQAAVLSVKLQYLDGWTKGRQENARRYEALFREAGLVNNPVGLPEAVYFKSGVEHYHIYNQFVIRVPDRDGLRAHLSRAGVGTEIYYPVPLHLQECFRGLGYAVGDFAEAERAAGETVALPIYPELILEQQAYVVRMIRAYYADRHAAGVARG